MTRLRVRLLKLGVHIVGPQARRRPKGIAASPPSPRRSGEMRRIASDDVSGPARTGSRAGSFRSSARGRPSQGDHELKSDIVPNPVSTDYRAISEFPKGRKYLISLSFRGKASVRPAQVGGFDVNIVIHGSTAVRGRADLVAYRWALWKLTAPWTHRTRPPHLGKRCAFPTSFHRAFPIKSFTKNPERPQNSVGKPG